MPILTPRRAFACFALKARRLALIGLGLLAAWAAPAWVHAQPQAACPPPMPTPSAEQLREGLHMARDRGFLWRLSRDGRSAWLFGTLHVGRLPWVFPGPQLRAALDAADTLALELDVTDPDVARQAVAAGRAPDDLPPPPAALKTRLAVQARLACLPEGALDGQHPVMQALTLTALAGRWDGLEAAFGQEVVLAGLARSQAKPLVSLESVAQQMGALIPSDSSSAFDLTDRTLRQLEHGRSRSLLHRLAGIWERGELEELTQYERWCDCVEGDEDRAQLRRLIDERNPQLASGIEALHAQGRSVIAAVGALHMVGAQGLPSLMRQRGFAVERVGFAPP